MLTNFVWSVFKDHLGFLTTKDESFLCKTFEDWLVFLVLVIDLFPFVFVSLASWIDSHESFGILDGSSKTFEFDNLKFAVDWSHIFLFSISIVADWELEVNNWSLGDAFNSNLKILLFWIKMQEVGDDLSVEIRFNFHWSESNKEVIITSWCNLSFLWEDAVWSSVKNS